MTEVAPKLSVVIVTWNVRELLTACLAALYREIATVPCEVIVVDNASSDGTVAAVTEAFPETVIIANRGNVGFPRANNQALRRATGEYVLFLNPDTEVGPGSVRACIEELDGDSAVGMAGCRLELEDGSVQLECARRPYLLRHLAIETLYLHMLRPHSRVFGDHLLSYWDHRGIRDVEAICGAFMLARTSVAREVGGLPEEVFMYHEDLAFCLRIQRAGWRIRYCGDVMTLHRWRGSSSKSTARLALLEGVYKLALIREAQGPLAAATGRMLFALRCVLRAAVAAAAAPFPMRRLRVRHPRVFDLRTHLIQLAWALAPFTVARHMPGADRSARTGARPGVRRAA